MQELMRKQLLSFAVSASVLLSVLGLKAAEQVTISEFLASNTSGLRDEDNLLADWIEIYNSGTNAVNLDGWFLTDAINNKTKWRFPATNINANAFVIVFADGKDRRVPGARLHANFNLSASGEYLGLIKPDGVTVATEFRQVNNGYPGQAPDVSYGFAALTTNSIAINTNSPVRWRIPNGSEGNWNTTNYDDSAWTVGTNGMGFGTFPSANYGATVLATAPVGYWRLDETSGSTAANLGSGAAAGTHNGTTVGIAGPRPPAFNGFEGNNNAVSFNGTSSYMAGPSQLLSGRGAFTVGGWINPQATPAARTGLFGQNDCVEFGFISATTLECWTPGGGSVTGVPYPFPLNQWHHIMAVADGVNIRIFIDGQVAGTGGTTTANYGTAAFNFNVGGGGIQDATGNFFNGMIDEVVVYHRALSSSEVLGLYQAGTNSSAAGSSSFVRTDVGAAMSNVNASAYLRIPFTVANSTNASLVTLRARYNDGFAAYINGALAVRVNAPETNLFNSAATNVHSSVAQETFVLGPGALLTGSNVLAIQALNIAPDDTNFLFEAHMTVTSVQADSSTPLYFTAPSPGALNVGGIANPGPAILDVTHAPNVPLDNQNINVTARITPTFYPVSNVVVRYRVMFDADAELPMFDDGVHGDGAAADGVWGATLPIANSSTNGQMIRWFFRAFDNRGNTSRWPLYAVPSGSAEYLGTVVDPSYVTSKLPIMHIFASNVVLNPGPNAAGTQPGADSQSGGFVSFFYDGEFYDNVKMELRGNSTAGFNKKSHRLDFNREHPLRHLPGYPRLRKTSFTADYPDQSFMRQELSFWLADQMGAPAPFYYPVRLQLNGAFYQLANHNDVHGEEYLERIGYDPNGALYNAAGQITPGKASTGGFDKKTRTWDSDADYLQLANAIAETVPNLQRTTNVYDLFDIPEALNYLVVGRWVHENDDVWANMSIYKDNDGDALWRIFPFDMNLSWGAMFSEGFTGVQATNDTHKSHPLYGGANIKALSNTTFFNRIYDVFFSVPEFREMYLRRLRTLLDTHIKPPGTTSNSTALEQRIIESRNLIAEEARLDRIWWGWPPNGGQSNFNPPANSEPFGSAARTNAATVNITNAVDEILSLFLYPRRAHFYQRHSITNTRAPLFNETINPGSNTVAGIPLEQPTNAVILIGQIESNPSSGFQGHEFIQLTNPNPFAVDISGWKLSNAVSFTFKPGTVIGSNRVLYLVPDWKAYKARTTIPMPGRALFVIGEYQGQFDARGEPVTLLDNVGRVVTTNSYAPTPSLAQLYLRITELMYYPARTNLGSSFGQEEFEYIELKNIGPVNLDLVGIHFTNGVNFAFTTNSAVTNLAPGQIVVLVKNAAAYFSRYGGAATVAGVYTGSLDNNGERITLHDKVGEQIMDFTYNNSWYPITEGLGFSMVIINENADWTTWDLKESWRASAENIGSPGTDDPAAPGAFAPVLVNEVLAHTDVPDVDKIEIYNPTTNTVDIGNWWISDDYFTPQKYRIPAPTFVGPGQFVTFGESDFNVGPNAFSFSSSGDEAFIFSGNAAGNLSGYAQGFDFGASATGVSFGRYTNSQTNVFFVAMSSNTFNFQNSAPKVGPVVISEIMYHPPDLLDGTDNSLDEYIELQNITTNAVALYDAAFPTNRWKLDDAVEFSFATNSVVPANGFLIVVNFNPTNAVLLANFRSKYGVPTNIAVLGPYSGKLDNNGESVELYQPNAPDADGTAFVLQDRVRYSDAAPWDANADGTGAALQRIVSASFGNDPTNWVATAPNPGAGYIGGALPSIVSQPVDTTGVLDRSTNSFSVTATGNNLRYQWRFNGAAILGATNSTLILERVQASQVGDYSVSVLNGAGMVISSNAHLSVVLPVSFSIQPTNQAVQPATNVTLVAQAVGTGPIRYQWRFEGVDIPNATNATYSFINANYPQHQGVYQVLATDSVSASLSSTAMVWVLVKPVWVIHPQPVTILAGGTATLFGVATGAPPIYYRFLRGGAPVLTNTSGVLVLSNVLATVSIRTFATNMASGLTGVGASPAGGATITVLPDADRDGMADTWETSYFGSVNTTNNVNNALEDPDGDGMINRDEYVAGTDPTNPLSLLKLYVSPTNASLLQFTAQTNISYSVQSRTNLVSTDWLTVTNITANTNISRIIDVPVVNPPPNPERYFRVVTPQILVLP